MALNFTKFFEGIRIKPKSASAADSLGEVEVLSSDNKIRFHNGSSSSPLIAETQVAAEVTIDNIKVDGNTVSSLDTNGDINLSPNGTGTVVVNTDLDVDNINVNGNTISSTNANGNISLDPNGTGSVSIEAPIDQLQQTTPANPSAGRNKIYFKSDDQLYTLTSGGVESQLAPSTVGPKVSALFPFIIGTAGQVTSGAATHSSFSSAQSSASDGDRIVLLNITLTETVTVSKKLKIEGLGAGSVFNGTITFASGSSESSLKDVRVTDDITINSGVNKIVTDIYIASGKTFIDNSDTSDINYLFAMQE